jgi:hypothetical protein
VNLYQRHAPSFPLFLRKVWESTNLKLRNHAVRDLVICVPSLKQET